MANGNTPTPTPGPAFSSAPALAPPTPGTGYLTPGQLQLQQQLAMEMLKSGSDYSPIRSPWQGMARVADALFGGMMMRQAWDREMAGRQRAISDAQSYGLGGGGLGGGGTGGGATGGGGGTEGATGGEGGGGKLSLGQMVGLAQNAGFQGDDAAHMAALAMAESGGNPGATGAAGEVGLTQINPDAWGPEMAATARDPQGAFNAAYRVYRQQGWGAWSTILRPAISRQTTTVCGF
jgi:hypothetical protein